MIAPTEKDIGRRVIYRSPGGDIVEEGWVVVLNNHFVFVRYRGDQYTKATRRQDLSWANDRS